MHAAAKEAWRKNNQRFAMVLDRMMGLRVVGAEAITRWCMSQVSGAAGLAYPPCCEAPYCVADGFHSFVGRRSALIGGRLAGGGR